MRILHERVARPDDIDMVMRDCCQFRMGPLELADLTGIDVNYPATRLIYEGYDQDPRLKTSFPNRALFEAGHFGGKTGRGSYRYDGEGTRIDSGVAIPVGFDAPCTEVVVSEPSDRLAIFLAEVGLIALAADDGRSAILAAPVGEDCATFAARTGTDHRRLVAVDLLCDTSRPVTVMTAPGADPHARGKVGAAIQASGRTVTIIRDSAGFISQRIRAQLANLGCEMAQIGIASPPDIDLAMELGLNYPNGPFAIATELGPAVVLEILTILQSITSDDRYRPSLWLRRRAKLGIPVDQGD